MISEKLMSKVWEAYQGDPMDPKNNTEAGLRRVVEVMVENESTPSPQTHVEPKRWLLEEHFPGGATRWHCFEHEHQCRARGLSSEHEVTVTPLFAGYPSPHTRKVG